MSSYPLVPIREIARIHYGKALKAEDRVESGLVPVFGSSGQIGFHNESLVDYPTLIVGRKGSVGQVTYADKGGWAIDTVFYTEFIKPNEVDLRFFFYTLKISRLERWTITTSIPGLSRDDFYATKIPFPPLEEQRRIAAILDKADAVRRKRQEAIALTEELLRSAFLEMFGDPVTNPKGWKTLTFGDLASAKGQIVDGPFGSSLKPECYVTSGIRVVRNFNIHDDFFNQSDFVYVTREKFAEICRSNVYPGDLLLSTKGTIGDVCIMPNLQGESVLSASGTVRIRLPEISPVLGEVIVHQMMQRSYKQYMKRFEAGTNQKYLNLSGIRKMELIVPPIDLQRKFVSTREKTLKLKSQQLGTFSNLNNLFNSLLQKAFCGEL